MKDKPTVGEEALKRLAAPDKTQTITETERAANKEYFDQINLCIDNHKDWDCPFYIVVQLKKERLLENVLRRYFIGRLSLPTPQWDQTVWRYYPKSGNLRYLWTLPDELSGWELMIGGREIGNEFQDIRTFTQLFLDKKLYAHFKAIFDKESKELSQTDSPYVQNIQQARKQDEETRELKRISAI